MSSSDTWKKIGIGAAITGGVILGIALIPITMGFGTAGIVAGSVAAGIQASIGSVTAGSAFAVCTSLGMTGVFSSTAAVGAIIGAGGLAAYLKNKFDAKKDAVLIDKVINENDNPDIIMKLIELRLPKQRREIANEYERLNSSNNFIEDVQNFVPNNKKEHFRNLMTPTEEINVRTEYVKKIIGDEGLEKYLENEFNEVNDVILIHEVMKRNDEPLIVVRLLNYRNVLQRKVINDKYMEMKLNIRKSLCSYINDFMNEHGEMEFITFLMDGINSII